MAYTKEALVTFFVQLTFYKMLMIVTHTQMDNVAQFWYTIFFTSNLMQGRSFSLTMHLSKQNYSSLQIWCKVEVSSDT